MEEFAPSTPKRIRPVAERMTKRIDTMTVTLLFFAQTMLPPSLMPAPMCPYQKQCSGYEQYACYYMKNSPIMPQLMVVAMSGYMQFHTCMNINNSIQSITNIRFIIFLILPHFTLSCLFPLTICSR